MNTFSFPYQRRHKKNSVAPLLDFFLACQALREHTKPKVQRATVEWRVEVGFLEEEKEIKVTEVDI